MGAGLGNAIGGLFGGAVEGYKTGIKMQQEAEKAARDAEAHKSAMATQEQQRKAAGLQIEQSQMQLDQQKRDEEANKLFETQAQNLANMRKGGFEGELVDANGQSVGTRKVYGDPAMVDSELAKQGLKFNPNTVQQLAPIDDGTFKKGLSLALVNHAVATRKATVEDLDKMTQFHKKIEAEGVTKALDYFKRTGDKEGMFKKFDEQGEHKSDQFKGIDFKVEKDQLGGTNVVGYRADPKTGKPVKVFDEFEDVILGSLSLEGKAAIINSNKQLATKEYGDTFRTGLTNNTQLAISNNKIAHDGAIAQRTFERDDRKDIAAASNTNVTAALRNPQGQMEAQRTQQMEAEIHGLAERLNREAGDTPGVALSKARAAVYQKYKVNTDSITGKK
jgi:hypothetical protein